MEQKKKSVGMTEQERQRFIGRLQGILINHVGKSRSISMGELYEQVFEKLYENRINDTRPLRHLLTELRHQGLQICSYGCGYYVASAESELKDFCDRRRKKALKILAMEAKMRKISMPELLGQIRIDLCESV